MFKSNSSTFYKPNLFLTSFMYNQYHIPKYKGTCHLTIPKTFSSIHRSLKIPRRIELNVFRRLGNFHWGFFSNSNIYMYVYAYICTYVHLYISPHIYIWHTYHLIFSLFLLNVNWQKDFFGHSLFHIGNIISKWPAEFIMSVKYNHPKGHHELCFLTSLGFQCELKHLLNSHNLYSHHLKGPTVTFAGYFPRCLQTVSRAENFLPCVCIYIHTHNCTYLLTNFCYYLYGIYFCMWYMHVYDVMYRSM